LHESGSASGPRCPRASQGSADVCSGLADKHKLEQASSAWRPALACIGPFPHGPQLRTTREEPGGGASTGSVAACLSISNSSLHPNCTQGRTICEESGGGRHPLAPPSGFYSGRAHRRPRQPGGHEPSIGPSVVQQKSRLKQAYRNSSDGCQQRVRRCSHSRAARALTFRAQC